jgi:hypothetical protein
MRKFKQSPVLPFDYGRSPMVASSAPGVDWLKLPPREIPAPRSRTSVGEQIMEGLRAIGRTRHSQTSVEDRVYRPRKKKH